MIRTPKDLRTRPTQARLRQALFNSIQAVVPDARVLDLFAGSGALGFEALSRGASEVVFVEMHRPVTHLLKQNAEDLRVTDRVQIVADSVDHAWKRLLELGPFDVVLADPPYSEGWELKLLESPGWDQLLRPEGLFLLEWGLVKSQVSELPENFPFLVKVREKNYADSVLSTYKRTHHESDLSGLV